MPASAAIESTVSGVGKISSKLDLARRQVRERCPGRAPRARASTCRLREICRPPTRAQGQFAKPKPPEETKDGKGATYWAQAYRKGARPSTSGGGGDARGGGSGGRPGEGRGGAAGIGVGGLSKASLVAAQARAAAAAAASTRR